MFWENYTSVCKHTLNNNNNKTMGFHCHYLVKSICFKIWMVPTNGTKELFFCVVFRYWAGRLVFYLIVFCWFIGLKLPNAACFIMYYHFNFILPSDYWLSFLMMCTDLNQWVSGYNHWFFPFSEDLVMWQPEQCWYFLEFPKLFHNRGTQKWLTSIPHLYIHLFISMRTCC